MQKNKNILVSVVVPVFNGEKYIKTCIDSLLHQNYENIEIIIVNDGSTDNTNQIIHSNYEKSKKIVIVDKKNSGVSDSRNIGIKIAKGKYITFVDADDTVEPEFVKYLYNLITENKSQVGLTRFPNKIIDEYESVQLPAKKDSIENISGNQAAKEMLYYKIVISSWNKMYDLDFLKKNNILFNKQLAFGEGFEFVINCFLHAKKISIGNMKYYNYRVDNANSVMTRFSPKLVYGSIEAQSQIEERIRSSNKIDLVKAQKYAYWHTCCDCLNTIIGCNVINDNMVLYHQLKKKCRSDSRYAFSSDVPIKDKIKAVLFWVSPPLTSRIINRFRTRRFSKDR